MRERITTHGDSETPTTRREGVKTVFERIQRKSLLKGPNGESAEISVAVIKEPKENAGELRHVNFWDLDKTLLVAEPIHAQAVEKIFPFFSKTEVSRRELHETYFAGFTLGNSFRE